MHNGHNHSYQDCSKITGNVILDDETLSELHAQLSIYIDQALGYHEGELGVRVRDAWEYYYGKLPLPVCNGSSSWTDRTVWESVNGTVQELINVFTSGEEAVKFRPIHYKDGASALSATKLVNQVLLQDNNGYQVLNDAFKEACVARNSFIKRYWESRDYTEVNKFRDITEEQLGILTASLVEDEDKIIAVEYEIDEDTGLVEGEIHYRVHKEGVKVEFTPFEQVMLEPQATSMKDLNYLGHRVRKTKDELIGMGFNEEVVKELSPASSDIEAGVIANERINNISPMNVSDVIMTGDEKADKVWLYENYLRTSLVTGELELLQIFTINGMILEVNRVSEIPFDTITPFPIPGFVYGESVVDITKEIQDLNTHTVRGMVDNIFNANFRRYVAIEGAYDRRSLLDNRPGGVVEVKRVDAVTPMPYHSLPQGMNHLLEYIEQRKEQRTGVTRLGQGLNADVFKNDNSEGMVNTMLSQSQGRLRQISRNIANTGIMDLMKGIYGLIRENGSEPIEVVTSQGVQMLDPRMLPPREDMIVSLAVGDGERKERAQILMGLFNGTLQNPSTKDFMSPQQVHHAASEIYKASGIYDVENYLSRPEDVPPKQPSPMEQLEMAKLQEEIKEIQAKQTSTLKDLEFKMQELEFKQLQAADDFTIRKEESLSSQDSSADKMMFEDKKLTIEMELKQRELDLKERELILEEKRLLIEAQLENIQGRGVAIGGGGQ
ncbi:portal protein [Vibrio phage Vp_R1]|uniref:Portal protein n=1 Tax=Vibrio phage Vp_R1 TaxID=2059867 RepID=A0A2H5BQ59_9CAUD|nr:portal protein [Vibrio phage Vp_R1]AUG88473.1 portal protein [Vibrio phage Vp_R1]